MNKSELSIEELREKSAEELSKIYNISRERATNLKTALKPEYHSILTNTRLTFEKMADELGVSYLTVATYRSALIKVGVEEKRKPRIIKESSSKVLSFLKDNPTTYDDIIKNTGVSPATIRNLRRKDKVRSIEISLGRRNLKHIFHSNQFVDGLTNRTMFYLPGEERLVGKKITEYMPKKFGRYERRSLTQRLRRFLPKEAFEVVHEYMHENAVK